MLVQWSDSFKHDHKGIYRAEVYLHNGSCDENGWRSQKSSKRARVLLATWGSDVNLVGPRMSLIFADSKNNADTNPPLSIDFSWVKKRKSEFAYIQ